MKYQFVCSGIKLARTTQEEIEQVLSKLEKTIYRSEELECRIVIKFINNRSKIEITIPTPYLLLRSEAEADDLIDASVIAKEKLVKQISKVKSRLDRSSNKVTLGKTFYMDEIEPNEEEIYIKNKVIHPEPMTLDDAINQMESLGHDFFIYEDIEDHTISVVYVRKSGGYGVIDIE